ncbi:MAG: DNA repair protein RadC [Deltaproteobacteria bacterium]|nr:DNA repair protein RadC [Deltaproteobacteria bacterium]
MLDLDPDARLALVGPRALGDAELLSFLLTRGGAPGLGALDLARVVLADVGGLARLVDMTEGRLRTISGIGPTKARRLLCAMTMVERLAERPVPRGVRITDPGQVFEMLRGRARRARREHFWVLARDARACRLSLEEVARGGANRVHVEVSQVFRVPILEAAESVVLAHNHPSGDPTPSAEDIALTRRIAAAGSLLGIDVADHVILGDETWVSLKELGYLPVDPVGFRADEAAE